MKLKSQLETVLAELGITEQELSTLESRMMFSVTNLQAQLAALDSQISTLTSLRTSVLQELQDAEVTVSKLIEVETPDVVTPEEPTELV